jgi:nucleoside phosphorylase
MSGAQVGNRQKRLSMSCPDVLIVTGLQMEFEAACNVGLSKGANSPGVTSWEERDSGTPAPYVIGDYISQDGASMRIALAHADRMSGRPVAFLAAWLVQRLSPRCLAMCGACAGNPDDVALGDVIVAELTYQYDEGKRTKKGFQGDHRQTPLRDQRWLRLLRNLKSKGLPSHGTPSASDAELWLLEQIYAGRNAKMHPARKGYFSDAVWEKRVKTLEKKGLISRHARAFKITNKGRDFVDASFAYDPPPKKLPFAIQVGPMASGNPVVKDGLTWDMLRGLGVRTVLGLEMEAATIGSTAQTAGLDWVVMKGVMDHADPNKDDRYKPFAARASAEVLFPFLVSQFAREVPVPILEAAEIAPTNSEQGNNQQTIDPQAIEYIASRAFAALIKALFDADYFLPGGGLKVILRSHLSPFISDSLSDRIRTEANHNASLEDITQTLLRNHLINEALSHLVRKVHDDWDKLLPYAKLSIHNLSERYPTIGLADLPPLRSDEKEVVSVKWFIADALFQEEWRSWVSRMAERGLDIEGETITWADFTKDVGYYCEQFSLLIKTRIEIDIALIQASTNQGLRRFFDYLFARAERSALQVMEVINEICRSYPNQAAAHHLFAAPMNDIVDPLIKDPLKVVPSLKWTETIKRYL